MWEIIGIIYCVAFLNVCEGLGDIRGPYETQNECLDREIEMLVELPPILQEIYFWIPADDFSYEGLGCAIQTGYL